MGVASTRGSKHAGANSVQQQPQPTGPLAGTLWGCTACAAQVNLSTVTARPALQATSGGRGTGGGTWFDLPDAPRGRLPIVSHCLSLLAHSCDGAGGRVAHPVGQIGSSARTHLHCAHCTAPECAGQGASGLQPDTIGPRMLITTCASCGDLLYDYHNLSQ